MVPFALLYYVAKLLLRGIPAAIELLATAASSLCRGLGRLCELLCSALAALAGGVARCCGAFRRCWREAVEAVVVPCKRCLFALHDAVVLPLCACARMLVLAPLSACRHVESGLLVAPRLGSPRLLRRAPPDAGLLYALERSTRVAQIAMKGCGATGCPLSNAWSCSLPTRRRASAPSTNIASRLSAPPCTAACRCYPAHT